MPPQPLSFSTTKTQHGSFPKGNLPSQRGRLDGTMPTDAPGIPRPPLREAPACYQRRSRRLSNGISHSYTVRVITGHSFIESYLLASIHADPNIVQNAASTLKQLSSHSTMPEVCSCPSHLSSPCSP